eukprot:jgi/Picsp_1/947/NSC_04431-R1_cell division cycle protein 20 homolog
MTSTIASPMRVPTSAQTPQKFTAPSRNGSKQMDRFIPNRSSSNLDSAQYNIALEMKDVENMNTNMAGSSPSKEYKKQLAANLGTDTSARVLAFKQKAPAPPEGHCSSLAALYSVNGVDTKPPKKFRAVPQQPERILDAPDLVDDYYLNLMDWGSSNTVAIALSQTVYLWNASGGDIQQLLATEGDTYVTSVNWAGDGKHVAVGFSDSNCQIWDAERLRPIRNLPGHSARVSSLAWNKHTLSTGSRDSSILHHDVRVRDHVIGRLRGHQQEWNRHEKEILSSHGFSQNQLCLWKYPSLAKVAELNGHTSRVLHLAQSPDGTTVASAAADETLRFWKCFGDGGSSSSSSAKSLGKAAVNGMSSSLLRTVNIR